jgi:uncharacterized membrane protein
MRNLFTIGRVFYGVSMTVLGFETVYYKDFPYMLIPPTQFWRPGFVGLTYISGAVLILAGVCITLVKNPRSIALFLGALLLMIFVIYYIPYELFSTTNFMHLGEWENAEKELALSCGAFIMAARFPENDETAVMMVLSKLIPLGTILFSATMISFGIAHFLYAQSVLDYIPSWVPNHLFWNYVAGSALISSGTAIILKIQQKLAAILLGTMILIWFIILHIPRVIASPAADLKDEVTSAFLALAYSGIAFAMAGAARKKD